MPDLIWGGENDCRHEWIENIIKGEVRKNEYILGGNSFAPRKESPAAFEKVAYNQPFCSLCGCWKGQLGLEPSPELYISHLVEIFREVRRVLRKDGVVFLNCGDSYAGNMSRASNGGRAGYGTPREGVFQRGSEIIKPKDLCLIPFRLAIALQEDGWWVRSVIIWSKPNPMPESVTDRPTESHEYILMLTKSAHYYYDQEAVREPHKEPWRGQGEIESNDFAHGEERNPSGFVRLYNPAGRNLRSVWTFPTQPYPKAHFATYPEKLVEICIKAATPEVGCCAKCGKPWVRIVKREIPDFPKAKRAEPYSHGGKNSCLNVSNSNNYKPETETLGWKPQCKCGLPQSENIGSIVLDPFAGSGTTLKVAAELNRRAIGYELSEQYCQLAVDRNKQAVMG